LNVVKFVSSIEALDARNVALPLALAVLQRGTWQIDEKTPIFTRKRSYLRDMIPRHWENDDTTKKADSNA
jgi:hypothetical protein